VNIFGTTISISLGSWHLRFAIALEDDANVDTMAVVRPAPHHLAAFKHHHLEA
jgi:hypothetical protein